MGGSEDVLGIHHKPSAGSVVLLEINKKAEHQMLLGEHKWHEMLKDPSKDDKDRVSRIYYSIYPSNRAAQKDGWKRINVESGWFDSFGLDKGHFARPYPPPCWCPPLREDIAGKAIARPLPVATKMAPALPPPLVPGSSEWVRSQQGTEASAFQGSHRGRGAQSKRARRGRGAANSGQGSAQGRPGDQTANTLRPHAHGRTNQTSSSESSTSSTVGALATASPGAATRAKPWAYGPTGLRKPPPADHPGAGGSTSPSTSTSGPPGLVHPNASSGGGNGAVPAALSDTYFAPPGLTRGPPRSTSVVQHGNAVTGGSVPLSWADEVAEEEEQAQASQASKPQSTVQADFDDESDDGIPVMYPGLSDDESDDDMHESYIPMHQRQNLELNDPITTSNVQRPVRDHHKDSGDDADDAEEPTNLWAGHVPEIFTVQNEDIPICPAHNSRKCKPAICIERKKLMRDAARRKEEEERQKARAAKAQAKRDAKNAKAKDVNGGSTTTGSALDEDGPQEEGESDRPKPPVGRRQQHRGGRGGRGKPRRGAPGAKA